MISALAWVRKGACQQVPDKMNLSEDEFNRISSHLGGELELAKDDLTHAQQQQQQEQEEKITDPNDPLAKYNLDDYDNEPVAASVSLFSNVKGLSYYAEDEQDPYITLQDGESDGDEELEELHVDPLDNLILTAKTEDDISHIEVYVYEEEHDNLYVHHDILLPSFPLCLEWLDFPMGNRASQSKGNFVAVGTFDPQVEIWDLDTVDSMFPEVILGRIPEAGAGLKKTKSKAGPARVAKRINPERHVDAVMSISWNTIQRNLIATGSADTTVKLWDMTRPEAAITQFTHHTNKVQAVAWNSIQPTVLLSGGYDQKVAAFDSRDPSSVIEWNLTADVECIKWDPVNTERFFVSSEDGVVKCFDARLPGKDIFTLHAHDGPVSALDVSSKLPGCMVTGSADKTVKLWSIKENKPICVVSRDLEVGKVFSSSFSPDSSYMLAVAGGNGKVVVWNLEHNPGVRNHFPNTNAHAAKPERPEVTGAIEDFDDSASEGEEEEGDLEMAGSGDSDNEDIQDR